MHNKRIGRDDLLKIEVRTSILVCQHSLIYDSGLALRPPRLGVSIPVVIAPVDVTVLLPVEVGALHLLAAVEVTIPLARTTVVIVTMIDATVTVPAVLMIEIEI